MSDALGTADRTRFQTYSSHVPAQEETVTRLPYELDKIAVVTGADGENIGRALAKMVAKYGSKSVGLVGLNPKGLEETADLVRATERFDGGKQGCEPRFFPGDVRNAALRKQTFDEMSAGGDVPRILLPFAGVTRDQPTVKIDKTTGKSVLMPEEDYDLVMTVNGKAVDYWSWDFVGRIGEVLFARQAAPNGEGRIVYPGSISDKGFAGQWPYSVGKAGFPARVQVARAEWHDRYGVDASMLRIGFTDSEMTRGMRASPGRAKALDAALKKTESGTLINPAEIAEGAHTLINDPQTNPLTIDNGFER